MAKLTAWLVTIIGLWFILAELNLLGSLVEWQGWIIALVVTVIGVSKLIRDYGKK